ncbi:MAG: DUF1292 domain-containing protein [Clostridia bacterium]|nr:DUF1292 domain-containing protein [Clostridia bacterium]
MAENEKEFEQEVEIPQEDLGTPIGSVDTVTLCDDEGNEYLFDLLGYVDFADKLYAVMVPAELYENEEEEQVVIMETYFEGNEPNFVFVEDEALAQQILDAYTQQEESDDVQ